VSRFSSGKEALRALRGRARRRRLVVEPPPSGESPSPPFEERHEYAPPPTFERFRAYGPPHVEEHRVGRPPTGLVEEPRASDPPPVEEPPPYAPPPLFGPPSPVEPVPPPSETPRDTPRRARRLKQRSGSAAQALGRGWRGLDVYVRRRIVLVVLLAALIGAFFAFAVPALPCQFPGGSACAAPDNAAKLVPGNALVYVHADLDRSTSQYQLASSAAARIPTLSAQLLEPFARTIPGTGGMAGFVSQVQPWLGHEAALALLPARGPPQQVNLLAIADEGGARRYQTTLVGPAPQTLPYRGIDVERGRRGVATAIVNGFLAIGTPAGLRQVIDAATDAKGATSLASTAAASDVRDELPASRVADAYLSPAGVRAIAGRATGLLSSLAPFLAPGATKGAAAAIVAGSGKLELEIRSALDPSRVKARPGFFAAFAPFDQTLASRLPASTLAYLGSGQPGRALTGLLGQAGTEEPGLARTFGRVLHRARAAARLRVRRDLLPALGDESAVALEPAPLSAKGRAARRTPYVLYVGGGVNETKARGALARLQRPLLRALGSPGRRHAPGIVAGNVGGAVTESLRLSPTLEVSAAVAQGLLVLATNPAGIGAVLQPVAGGLAASDSFGSATSGLGSGQSLLAYLNLRGLVAVGERAGLTANPGYAALAGELHRLEALGVSVASAPDRLATSVRLLVGG
jgi:Protein of unknown function (DUF3352)